MAIAFKYGLTELSLNLPARAVTLSHTEPQLSVGPDTFKSNLHSNLNNLKKPVSDVGIVVSDKTRLCEYPTYLPLLTEVLSDLGINADDITFHIAYGTHQIQSEEESFASYGETYKRYKFVHHDSRDESRLTSLGITSRGTEVKISKKVLEHDLLITFGAILHHYFAGFGGGRKLLFPGVAGYHSILQNHQLFLDFEQMKIKEGSQSGNLDTNPLALDLEEINTFLPKRMEIHAILNSHKKVCEIYFGNTYDSFKKACKRYDQFFRYKEDRLFDMVVASAGGYPKDINFIQGHKSLHNAASFVKENGKLVIFAECKEGIGNQAFMDIYKIGGWEQIFYKMKQCYANNAGTAVAMMYKSQRIKIHFVTSLDKETCILMGAIKTSSQQAIQLIEEEQGEVAWIENAGLLYK